MDLYLMKPLRIQIWELKKHLWDVIMALLIEMVSYSTLFEEKSLFRQAFFSDNGTLYVFNQMTFKIPD